MDTEEKSTRNGDGDTSLVAELRGSLPPDVSRDEYRRHLVENLG